MLNEIYAKTGLLVKLGEIEGLVIETSTFAKGDFITKVGEVEKYIYIIKEGGVKVSYETNATDYILAFWFQGDIFASYTSFLEQSPSLTSIVAIAKTVVQRVGYEQLQQFYSKYHKVSEIGRKLTEAIFIYKAKRELEFLSRTAEERYFDLIQKSGRLILEQPVKDIASYLGIKPESLSRIRRKVKLSQCSYNFLFPIVGTSLTTLGF